MAAHTCTVMVQAPLETQKGRRTAGTWTTLGDSGKAEPSMRYTSAYGRRLHQTSGTGVSYCRTLSEEGDGFWRRRRYFHEWCKGMRILQQGIVRCVNRAGLGSVANIPGTGTQKVLVQQAMRMPRHVLPHIGARIPARTIGSAPV